MYSQRVKSVMDRRKFAKAKPELSVHKAAILMASRNVGAVVVLEGDTLIGILTERDIAFRVVAAGLDPDVTTVRHVMSPNPITIAPAESYGSGLLTMHEHGFRHLPVVDNGKVIGIISARHALDPDMEEFVAESRRRDALRSSRI